MLLAPRAHLLTRLVARHRTRPHRVADSRSFGLQRLPVFAELGALRRRERSDAAAGDVAPDFGARRRRTRPCPDAGADASPERGTYDAGADPARGEHTPGCLPFRHRESSCHHPLARIPDDAAWREALACLALRLGGRTGRRWPSWRRTLRAE